MPESKKCAHTACTCTVPEGKKYCSQICEDSKQFTSIKCDCKHPGCSAS
jgi:hypothetical protein